jgi:hypothetical protein
MAMERRSPPNLGLLITSTVRSESRNIISGIQYDTDIPYPVSHYAEGSLMPILIQRMIFDLVPQRSPFLIRPIVRKVFDQLIKLLVEPEIKKNLTMVCDDELEDLFIY